jgi:hypothetical protein
MECTNCGNEMVHIIGNVMIDDCEISCVPHDTCDNCGSEAFTEETIRIIYSFYRKMTKANTKYMEYEEL